MKNAIGGVMVLALGTMMACAAPSVAEGQGATTSHLNLQSDTVWSKPQISVCWDRSMLTPGRYKNQDFGPKDNALAEKQQWVQEIAENEWNAKTSVQFVGWQDCDDNDDESVHIFAIDSLVTGDCGGNAPGQSCAHDLGRKAAGKGLFLNLAFGDEILYTSRLAQSAVDTGDDLSAEALDPRPNDVGGTWWMPSACMDDFPDAWFTGSDNSKLQQNVNDPVVLAQANGIIKNCIQFNALHELGHIAGFAHEQYRTDDPAAQAKCAAIEKARNIPDDIGNIDKSSAGDKPLGTFELQSIMSYCRTDNAAALTDEDVKMTNAVYGDSKKAAVPGDDDDADSAEDGKDGASINGGIGGKGGKAGASK